MSAQKITTGSFVTALPGAFVPDEPAAESTPAPPPPSPGREQRPRKVARLAVKVVVLIALVLGYAVRLLWRVATLDRHSVAGRLVVLALKATALIWLIRVAGDIYVSEVMQ